MGEKSNARTRQPVSGAAAAISRSTRSCTAALEITPFLPGASRPASNWGFTREISRPSSPSTCRSAGRIFNMEMKDTSITPSVGGSGNISRVSVRALVCSI